MVLLESSSAPRPRLRARLLRAAAAVSTPLLPQDYLSLVDPLWGSADLRGRVVEVHREAAGATTLVLEPGHGWAGHRAGQWVRVGVPVDGVLHRRSYSLTGPPRADGLISITVGAVASGVVSSALAGVRTGEVLRLSQADGEFVLPGPVPSSPLLFVTAGTGLTPVMGMLRELTATGTPLDVVVVHSARTPAAVLFGTELRALAAAHPGLRLVERHTAVSGRLVPADLDALVPDRLDRTAYACGPGALLDDLEAHWAATGSVLHTERFAPRLAPVSDGAGGTVAFTRQTAVGTSDGAVPMLTAGEDAGALMPSGCRMGICFGCVVPLVSGQVRDVRTGDVHGEPGDLVQTCISAPAGDVVLDA